MRAEGRFFVRCAARDLRIDFSKGAVEVLIIDSSNPSSGTHTSVHSYTGQITGGTWDNVSLNLQLSSVLDAVGTDIPRRALTKKLVGNLPIANNVRLQ